MSAKSGFTVAEVLVTVAVIGILAGIAVMKITDTKDAVGREKLDVDVLKLNQIISLYYAEGGNLNGLTSPQAILDKLKTVRADADAKRQVSPMTGRAIDVRLAAKNGIAAAGNRKAIWNSITQRFEITTAAAVATNSVSEFYLDDSLISVNYPTESRTRSTMLYNSADGWVWGINASVGTQAALTPVDGTLTNETLNDFDPNAVIPTTNTTSASTTSGTTTSTSTTSSSTTSGTATSGSTTSTSTTSSSTTSSSTTSSSTTSTSTTGTPVVTKLPKPTNSPNGATFSAGAFPSTISVTAGSPLPASGSILKYRITPSGGSTGAWITYSGPVAITAGAKFESQHQTTDAVLYSNGDVDSDTYFKLVDSFTGSHVPSWINVAGGPNLLYTVANADPAAIELSHGDTRLDLGGGEYLDAGVENRLNFARTDFNSVVANTDFTLGQLTILNGTTFNDSEATSGTLKLVITTTTPVTQSGTVNLNYNMVSTPNTSDRLASADTVTLSNPTTSFAIVTNGVTYTLQIRMESLDAESGIVTGSTFYVYEGASARARLVGKFVSNK